MYLFRPLLTAASAAPFFASLLVHGLHFRVYAASTSAIPEKTVSKSGFVTSFARVLRGNTIRGNRTRTSEWKMAL